MKKIFITLFIALFGLGASAQTKGEQNIGVHILYGTDWSNIGFGVKYQNNITDAIRLEAVGEYYPETDGYSMFDISINGHYLFPLSDKVIAYPLVGLNYTSDKQKLGMDDVEEDEDVFENKNSNIGLNFGGGIQYNLTNKFRIGAELNYQLLNGLNIGVGLTFTL